MEILESSNITATPWWTIVSVIMIGGGIVLGLIAFVDEQIEKSAIFLIIALIGLLIRFITPTEIPTDKMSYTVEITDNTLYQTLIDKGYSFKRIFENKEIYTIIGDVLQ